MSVVDVKNLLITTLNSTFVDSKTEESLYPIFLQGSLSDDDVYPPSFFTYWNNGTSDAMFYDNQENVCVWDLDLNFYSVDPDLVNSVLLTAKRELKKVGFIIDGSGYDVLSDEISHTGRGMNLYYRQKY